MTWALLRTAWGVLSKIPWWIYVAVGLVLYHFAAIHHYEAIARDECNAAWQAKIKKEQADYETQLAALKAKQQEVITKTVIEYRDRIKVVKEKGDEVVRYVDRAVPMDSPLLSGGVRFIHDAAAAGQLPDHPDRAAAAADPVETSTLLRTVAGNYATCRADQERLAALQKLVSGLSQK